MRNFITLWLLLTPITAAAQDWRALSGTEIETALSARVLQYENGASQNFFQDGRTLYEVANGVSWGKWWAERARYCSSWPPSETPSCYSVETQGLLVRFTGATGDVTVGQYVDLN